MLFWQLASPPVPPPNPLGQAPRAQTVAGSLSPAPSTCPVFPAASLPPGEEKPPDNSRSVDYISREAPWHFSQPPPGTQAPCALSTSGAGEDCVRCLLGFVVSPAFSDLSISRSRTTSLGYPGAESPVTCQGADRACVPPLIRCCSEVVVARVVCV